jgi:SAM-dependent methyltransferase
MSLYSLFAADYELVFPFRDEVYRFLRSHAGEPGCRVLDLGCGPGHYCGKFASDGYAATGIDLDEAMVAEALNRYPAAAFRCLDMREVDAVGNGFRCVYSIGNVMAHLPPWELAGLVGRIGDMIVPGGSWIMQVMNWDAFAGVSSYEFPVRTIERDGGTATFHRSYRFRTDGSVLFSVSLRQSGQELFREDATLYPASMDRYLQVHEESGFVPAGIHADFTGSAVRGVPGSGLVMAFRKT